MVSQFTQRPTRPHSIVAEIPNSVLLETWCFDVRNHRRLLFRDPIRVLSTSKLDEIPDIFRQVEEALAVGFYVAGFLSYECGYHFQPFGRVELADSKLPLIWFGVYRSPIIDDQLARKDLDSSISPRNEGAHGLTATRSSLTISADDYCARVRRIKEYIEAGDTYQVNFTDSVQTQTTSLAADIFADLSRSQPAPYRAFLNVANHQILSFSPELFFRIECGRIVTRPMKGTAARGLDTDEDVEAAKWLQNDEKNRAEHVMIVDLLRNDLGRICTMGSVHVDDIFTVEKYRTLFQMTSTVSGTLRPNLSYLEIFKSMFPSGSITGAPKIRTMQIIRELEQRPRGVYTGAIGFIAPDHSCIFNVAIRTLVLKDGQARMGVGSGIVADSIPSDEYRECLLKASFLHRPYLEFQLIETILWDHHFTFLSMHLDRMQSSAAYFEFPFDDSAITFALNEQEDGFVAGMHYRVRLLLDSKGRIAVRTTPYVPDQTTGRVRISSERTSSQDVFLRHKTTRRDQYDRLYQEARANGFDEIFFLNEKEEVTEGAVSNIFIQRGGKLLTPPLRSGILPGVFRRHILETCDNVEERALSFSDLETADGVFFCNSVRGLLQAKSLHFEIPPH